MSARNGSDPAMAAPAVSPRPSPAHPGWVTWAGLAVVLAAAAVLSFAGLRDLALMVGITVWLAPLLPVCVDAGAAVATGVWLSRRQHPDAQRFARRLTWTLLVLTVAGNGVHQGLAAAGVKPWWWLAVVVGAIPPGVVGGCVHLAVLVGRATGHADDTPRPESATRNEPQPPATDEAGEDRAAELIADGAGRRRLARELAISEHEARALLATHRNGNLR